MSRIPSHLQKKLGRRGFLKLAGVAAASGVAGRLAASDAARASEPAAAPAARPAPAVVPRNAQYGRGRGRYPVARRS